MWWSHRPLCAGQESLPFARLFQYGLHDHEEYEDPTLGKRDAWNRFPVLQLLQPPKFRVPGGLSWSWAPYRRDLLPRAAAHKHSWKRFELRSRCGPEDDSVEG